MPLGAGLDCVVGPSGEAHQEVREETDEQGSPSLTKQLGAKYPNQRQNQTSKKGAQHYAPNKGASGFCPETPKTVASTHERCG